MSPALNAYLTLLRPYQWIKNILLFTPLFFSGRVDLASVLTVSGAVLCFCLASSLGYITNDWVDRDRDKNHPEKRTRPFCSGLVSGKQAIVLWGLIFVLLTSFMLLLQLPTEFLFYLVVYLVLTIIYSLYLKRIVILEIFVVSMGFVLRVMAGGAACSIPISGWLFMTVFFMSMIISVAKRMTELQVLARKASMHRESLEEYSSSYLSNLLWTLGGVTLVVYALYTVEKGSGLVYSVLPATYGIVRFFLLADHGKGGDPIKALFADTQLLVTTLVFFLFLGLKIYL